MAGGDITQYLIQARSGSSQAFDEVFPLVYDELRSIAHQRLSRFGAGDTLSTTALVHEAYLRMVDQTRIEWQDRAHFFAIASRAMRFILVDYARARMAEKRGGGAARLTWTEAHAVVESRTTDLIALHDVLELLAEKDARLSRIVEYKFFGGLTYEEIATVTGMSVPTIKRDWARARAWLYRAMREDDASA